MLAGAVRLGIRVFDTAPAYAFSQARLGNFLAELPADARAELVIMTKAGEHWDLAAGTSFVDHSKDALRGSIDRSLRLLQRVDVLQIHKATLEVVDHPDTVAAIEHARVCGIAEFGASVSSLDAGLRALESGLYSALQFPLNGARSTPCRAAAIRAKRACRSPIGHLRGPPGRRRRKQGSSGTRRLRSSTKDGSGIVLTTGKLSPSTKSRIFVPVRARRRVPPHDRRDAVAGGRPLAPVPMRAARARKPYGTIKPDPMAWPRPPILLASALDGGFGFALIRMDRPVCCSMSKAPVLRTRSLSFR